MDQEAEDRVAAIRQLWTDGDYAAVGDGFRAAAQRLTDELDVAGRRVLDAATGTGNFAIAAARAGAEVHAFDLTPLLLAEARRRAEATGVQVTFVEGDLLDVPYQDEDFDLVVSTFGAFLADDPARCAAELVRVTRPGGTVVATAWAAAAAFSRMVMVAHEHDPEVVPDGRPSPWADVSRLREVVAGIPVAEVRVTQRQLPLRFADAEAALAFYEETSGPVQRLATGFGERWPRVRAAVVESWDGCASPMDGGIALPATYTVAELVRA